MLFLMMGFFTWLKFKMLYGRENPGIQTTITERFYSESDKVDLAHLYHSQETDPDHKKGFNIAFRIVNSKSEARHDPAYINWIALFLTSDGQKTIGK
jgi:hypothetical protein